MKTETSMTNRPPAATGKPVLEQLRASSVAAARGAAKGQSAGLSFQTLFADIQPKAGLFQDMTQKLAERRAEQGRLERERGRSRPRAEDMQAAPALTPQRQPEPQRPARSNDSRAQAPGRSEPVRSPSAQAQAQTRPSRQTDGSRQAGASQRQPAAASAPEQNTAPAHGGRAHTTASGPDEGQETRQGAVQQAEGMGRSDETAQTREAGSSGSTTGTDGIRASTGAATVTPGKAPGGNSTGDAAVQTADAAQTAANTALRGSGAARAGQPGGDTGAGSASALSRAGTAGQVLPEGVSVTTASTAMDAGNGSEAAADAPVDEAALQQLAQDMARVNGTDAETPATGQGLAQDDTAAPTAMPADADAADALPAELASTAAGGASSARRGPAATASASVGTQAGRGKVDMASAGAGMPATARSAAATSSAGTGTGASSSGQEDRAAAGVQPASPAGDGPATPLAAGPARAEGTPFSLGLATPAAPAHSPSRVDGSPLLSSRIDSPVHSEEFREQFARQVAGVVVQGQDRAEIRLTPAELGPIRIRIALNAEEAALDISAAHAATRAAIESSVHTLRQMLADHGLRLADYRMDQGLMSQQRQPGQEHAAGAQQFGAAFGQGNGQGGNGRGNPDAHSTGRDMAATGSSPAAVSGSTGGSRRGGDTAADSRLDLFA